MDVAQLTYEPQLQTITGITAGQEHVNLLKHVKHIEDAIHILTVCLLPEEIGLRGTWEETVDQF